MPANDVHDRQHSDENRLIDHGPGDTKPRPGGSQAEVDDKFADIVNNEYKTGDIARTVRKAENEAAVGKDVIATGEAKVGVSATEAGTAAGIAASKKDLGDKEESSGFFREEEDDDKPAAKPKAKGRLTRRQKIGGVMALFALVGGGGSGMFAIISGPLQFIHIGQLLSGLHLDEKNDEGDARMLKIARYIRYYQKGDPERTRMGVLGNKVADKIEAKFNKAGIESQYSSVLGYSEKIVLDTEKLSGTGQFDNIQGQTPEETAKFFEDKYKVKVTSLGNGRYSLDTQNLGYRQFNSLTRSLMRAAGYHYLSPAIGARFMGVRAGINWRPIAKLDKKILKTLEDRYNKWKENQKADVKDGVRAAPVDAKSAPSDEEGKPPPGQDGADETNKLGQDAAGVGDDAGKLSAFQSSIHAKIAGGGLGLIGLLCLGVSIANHVDEINQANVILPMMRMGMDSVAEGNQVEEGRDVDQEQLGFKSKLLYDAKNQSSWSDARSINAELGKPGGKDIPQSARVDPQGNVITRLIAAVPPITSVCEAAGSTIGSVLITGASLVLSGPISTILQTAFGLVATGPLEEWLAKIFSANQIDPLAAGADRGNFMNYGVRLAANDIATSQGGLPISDADAAQLASITRGSSDEEFQSKNIATRLFDAKDSRSLISQIIDKQIPDDPVANMNHVANAALNINKTLLSSVGSVFNKTLHAAPLDKSYNYGFPDVAFTTNEMNDTRVKNPFENANTAAEILDRNSATTSPDDPQDNYIARAKACFGVEIVKTASNADPTQNAPPEVYAVKPPVQGQIPLSKAVGTPQDSPNKCFDPSDDWFHVRFYIFDSQMMNASACSEGDQQACVDTGMSGGGGTAAAGPATTCGTAGASGGTITGPGVLNSPIPANPVIDPSSASVVAGFTKPSYANIDAYGVTVVCSGPGDQAYTVSSGNPDWGPNPFDAQVQGATGTGSCNPLHIPTGTKPPTGTDGWVIVIDSTKPGLYCAMWVAKFNNNQWSMEYGGVYNLNGGGMPQLAGSGSGSNIPQSPILASEIDAGVINHALGFAINTNKPGHRDPATKDDTHTNGPFQEGMRFQLDPSFDCNTIKAKGEHAVCVALQIYGAYDVDNGGGPGWFFQANGSQSIYQSAGITGDYMPFNDIPMNRMRLLAHWQGN